MMTSTTYIAPEIIQQELLRRHEDHLQKLTRTLKKLGVSDSMIKQHVTEIVEDYQSVMRRTLNLN